MPLRFCQDTSDRERTASRLLYRPTHNNKSDSELGLGLDVDQTRSGQKYTAVRTGCCSKKGTIKRKKNRGDIAHAHTHTSSKRARGDTTIESKNTAVHVPCSSVYECDVFVCVCVYVCTDGK